MAKPTSQRPSFDDSLLATPSPPIPKARRLNLMTGLLLLLSVIIVVLSILVIRNWLGAEKTDATTTSATLTNHSPGSQDDKKNLAPYTETLANGVKLEMVPIPPGSFMMGSPSGEKNRFNDEGPQHRVTISYPFYMGKYEVTQAQWQAVMGTNPSEFKGDNRPVDHVNWDEAKEFCQRLSTQSGRQYRLSTEAEWEYACRAGTTTAFAFGDMLNSNQANFDGNYPYGGAQAGPFRQETTSVGSFRPNDWGLYDMHGNVWEWCEDIGHENYQNAPVDGSSWASDGQFSMRMLRGGSFNEDGLRCRSAIRLASAPGIRARNAGLRVVLVANK